MSRIPAPWQASGMPSQLGLLCTSISTAQHRLASMLLWTAMRSGKLLIVASKAARVKDSLEGCLM